MTTGRSIRWKCRRVRRAGGFLQAVLLAALLVAIPAATPPVIAQGSGEVWWESAAEETRDQVQAVQDTVSGTLAKIEEARAGLDQVEEWANQNLSGQAQVDLLNRVFAARNALESQSRPLQIFDSRLGQVTSVVDKAFAIKDMVDAVQQQRGGNAGKALYVLAQAMQAANVDIPIVGDFIQFYGEAAAAMLGAINDISNTIETNRNQGMIGTGTYGGVDSPLYQALVTQFGEDFAAGYTFAPGNHPYIYRSIEQGDAFTLIWDPDSGTWTKVDQPPGTVEALYRSYLIAKGQPTPSLLAGLAIAGADQALQRIDAGQELVTLWEGWSTNFNSVFDQINRNNDYALIGLLGDPALFAARFAHDQAFNAQVRQWVADMYLAALKDRGLGLGPDTATADLLAAWAARFGIALPAAPTVAYHDCAYHDCPCHDHDDVAATGWPSPRDRPRFTGTSDRHRVDPHSFRRFREHGRQQQDRPRQGCRAQCVGQRGRQHRSRLDRLLRLW